LVQCDGRVLHKAVVPAGEIGQVVARLLEDYPCSALALGDRTAASDIEAAIGERVQVEAVFVDEHRSTEQGRRRYFRDNRPRGWRRLLPIGLQTPPCPYDDYVAVVLAERYLDSLRRR
jgi:hypothetical protein